MSGNDPSYAVTPTVAFDKDAQTATLTFDTPLTPGKHRLAIDYTGKINQQALHYRRDWHLHGVL